MRSVMGLLTSFVKLDAKIRPSLSYEIILAKLGERNQLNF